MKYRGVTKGNVERVKNTNGNHDEIAMDLSLVLDSTCSAPFTEDGGSPKYEVLKANAVDHNSKDVVYTVIKDISHTVHIEFWYFHTDKSPLKAGQIIEAGDLVCYTAQNGNWEAPHLHLEARINGKHLNPDNYFALMKGGRNGILLGFPKQPPVPEETVTLKASEWKKYNQDLRDSIMTIVALKDTIKANGLVVEKLNETIISLQGERDTLKADIASISTILGVEYNPLKPWADQHYKYEEAVQIIKNEVLNTYSSTDLIAMVISRNIENIKKFILAVLSLFKKKK